MKKYIAIKSFATQDLNQLVINGDPIYGYGTVNRLGLYCHATRNYIGSISGKKKIEKHLKEKE